MYVNVLIRVLKYAVPVIVTLLEKSSLLDKVFGSTDVGKAFDRKTDNT